MRYPGCLSSGAVFLCRGGQAGTFRAQKFHRLLSGPQKPKLALVLRRPERRARKAAARGSSAQAARRAGGLVLGQIDPSESTGAVRSGIRSLEGLLLGAPMRHVQKKLRFWGAPLRAAARGVRALGFGAPRCPPCSPGPGGWVDAPPAPGYLRTALGA